MTIQKIGICAAATLLCLAPAAFSRTRVVVIGVRDYTGDALTKPVAFAENDATLFGTFSVQRSLDPAPVVLTFPPVAYQLNGVRAQSKAANLPAVENELNALFAQAGPEDIVYVFSSSR